MMVDPSLEKRFAGRTVFLTGAASGIGREMSRMLLAAGARVIAVDRDEAGLRSLEEELGGKLVWRTLDVTDAAAYEAVVDSVEREVGPIDDLFNNAGVSWLGEAHKVPYAKWKWLLDINVMGVANGIAAIYPRMVKRNKGCIINTASIAGSTGYATAAAYTASKAAVIEMTRSLRSEASAYGVKVVLLCPGYVNTNIFTQERVMGAKLGKVIDDMPVKMLTPDRAARFILKGIASGKTQVIFPLNAKIFWLASRWMPSWLGPVQRKLIAAFRS